MDDLSLIFLATVGSHAYGLAREDSDIDKFGIYVAPTRDFWRLEKPAEHIVHHGPGMDDIKLFEVEKFIRLALKCNPSVVELLYLGPQGIEVLEEDYLELRAARTAFLCEEGVRERFGGYARDQAKLLERRRRQGKEGFSSDTAKRTPKHARHCFRLLRQGRELLETGYVHVAVDDPESYWAFDDFTVDEILERFDEEYAQFAATPSVLPQAPDVERIEQLLMDIRQRHMGDPVAAV